jgi:hypothetical protein
MVIDPLSQVALMREPRVSVAGRYFEWMACMVCMGINCPWNPRFRMGSPGNSSDQSRHVHEVPLSGPMRRNMDRLDSITVPSA